MKNLNLSNLSVKEKLVAKYLEKDNPKQDTKRTDINILLNRVKLNQKNESRKNCIFQLQHQQVYFYLVLLFSNN